MKLNISNPTTGMQKLFEIDDDKKLLPFFDKRMATEVSGDSLGDEFKGYIFKISGGNDKQGFPMKQGILCNHRVRLLFKKGMSCYRERRAGCRKRKSVRGCVVGPDLAVLALTLVKKGADDIPGLTDDNKPRRLGPKRAANIRKLFNLEKKDDPRKFVVRRDIERAEGKKTKSKAPRIQRLVTPAMLQRKRYFRSQTRNRMEEAKEMKKAYAKRLSEYRQEQKEARAAEVAKKKKPHDSAVQEKIDAVKEQAAFASRERATAERREVQARPPIASRLESRKPNATAMLLPYFRGTGTDNHGRRLEEIRRWDFDQMEMVHNYIQWMFPTDEMSMFNADAPMMTPEIQREFKEDPALRHELRLNFERFCQFLGLEVRREEGGGVVVVLCGLFAERRPDCWSSHFGDNHNWLRISRVLQCLGLCSMPEEQKAFMACLEEIADKGLAQCGQSIPHWRARARTLPAI